MLLGYSIIMTSSKTVTSKNRLARSMYENLTSILHARLARSCIKSCKPCTKNEAFLARYKKFCKSCKKNLSDHILAGVWSNVNDLALFSCKIFISCKKSYVLVQDFQDMCKILHFLQEKYLQNLHSYFLQDYFYWVSKSEEWVWWNSIQMVNQLVQLYQTASLFLAVQGVQVKVL